MSVGYQVALAIITGLAFLLLAYRLSTRRFLNNASLWQKAKDRSDFTDIGMGVLMVALAALLLTAFFSKGAGAEVAKSESEPAIAAANLDAAPENERLERNGPILLVPRYAPDSQSIVVRLFLKVEQICTATLHNVAVARTEGILDPNILASVFMERTDRTDIDTAAHEACAELELLLMTLG